MSRYIILSSKKWNVKLLDNLKQKHSNIEWLLIHDQNQFQYENIRSLNPDKIFIPHWSYIIPDTIFDNFECILFHMTDLPFGRGGSPLQNLIVRGYKNTMISAIKVEEGLDTGDIYIKKDLSLLGTAEEIFLRATDTIGEMISEIITKNIKPVPQIGESEVFKRRKPSDGDISQLKSVEEVFDYIRMLDAEGYPNAYLETEFFKFEFSRASLKSGEKLIADVRITKK
ncbi:formyltransferase family protein [Marivirga tractuosa]|uniref:formyltransferase family protein n=1 Tax=Marivirga tractuosa TaxID=1006 RepID=UPI0035CFB415